VRRQLRLDNASHSACGIRAGNAWLRALELLANPVVFCENSEVVDTMVIGVCSMDEWIPFTSLDCDLPKDVKRFGAK